MMSPIQRIVGIVVLVPILISACEPFPGEDLLRSFPAGYIDSPYVVPDGSALYFLHSTVSTIDMLQGNPSAKPVTAYLPGHQGQNGAYWWNTDIYVIFKNPDGTWGPPQNLGPTINSEHLEGGPWTNTDQTVLIFQRESVTDPSLSGTFISRREGKDELWGEPVRLPGKLGTFGATGFADLHMAPSGNLYFWSEDSEQVAGNGTLYWAQNIGPNEWAAAELLPESFQSDLDESQPWVNDDETVLYFNRRGEDGNTQLWRATRADSSAEWGIPMLVPLAGFDNGNGYVVWGEPSFMYDGTMFFVRFDTSTEDWNAELLSSVGGQDGSYTTPQKLVFENER
jgi:hypothetical protein